MQAVFEILGITPPRKMLYFLILEKIKGKPQMSLLTDEGFEFCANDFVCALRLDLHESCRTAICVQLVRTHYSEEKAENRVMKFILSTSPLGRARAI